jgi:hypothetical protein
MSKKLNGEFKVIQIYFCGSIFSKTFLVVGVKYWTRERTVLLVGWDPGGQSNMAQQPTK